IARRVVRELGVDVPKTAFALPGAADPAHVAAQLDVEPALALHLARTYGSLAHEVLATSSDVRPLADGPPEVVAQHVYARPHDAVADRAFTELLPRRPRLEEVVEVCAGRIALDVELKEAGAEDEVLDVLTRTLALDRFVVTSFLVDVVAAVAQRHPDVRTGLL